MITGTTRSGALTVRILVIPMIMVGRRRR